MIILLLNVRGLGKDYKRTCVRRLCYDHKSRSWGFMKHSPKHFLYKWTPAQVYLLLGHPKSVNLCGSGGVSFFWQIFRLFFASFRFLVVLVRVVVVVERIVVGVVEDAEIVVKVAVVEDNIAQVCIWWNSILATRRSKLRLWRYYVCGWMCSGIRWRWWVWILRHLEKVIDKSIIWMTHFCHRE